MRALAPRQWLLDPQAEVLAGAALYVPDAVVRVLGLHAHLRDAVVLLVQLRAHVLQPHKLRAQLPSF